jgi:hypothetical protein
VVTDAVAVLDSSGENVRDCFNPAVGMPGKAGQVILGPLVPEIVEKKEWIEVRCIAEAKGTAQVHACAFERRLRLDESLNGSNGHLGLLCLHPCLIPRCN